MAGDSQSSFFSSITPQQVLAVLTLVSSTVLLQIQPLQSRRELDLAGPASALGDDHKFLASHIEDPLMALKAQKVVDPGVENFDPSAQVKAFSHWGYFLEIEEAVEDNRKVQVICAMLRSGTDLASREQRHRARLAVVSALASSGYVPESSRRMQVCRLKDIVSKNPEAFVMDWKLGNDTMDVPFEWFKPTGVLPGFGEKKRFSKICVLWFDMEAVMGREMNPKPLERMRSILHAMLTGHPRPITAAQRQEFDPSLVETALLGPPDSGTLSVMLAEAQTAYAKGRKSDRLWEQSLIMASPYATSSAEALMRSAGRSDRSRATGYTEADRRVREEEVSLWMDAALRGQQAEPGVQNLFTRTPLSDDHVAEALVDELGRRGIDFSAADGEEETKRGDIVLISEFDTSYGRELPLGFLSAAGVSNPKKVLNEPGSRWHWTAFTRGLDGRFGAAVHLESAAKSGGDARNSVAGDVPRGPDQTDALRRLAVQLVELHQSRQREGKPGIVAVGVLGGDVYDKLLVFRALRPLLTNSLFFTNNLDAWLWESNELRTTRNLIVGSPFDLRLSDRWQAGKPPFRDSYQTSVYAAALTLITGADELKSAVRPNGVRKREARLFEVGRELPVDMSLSTGGSSLHPDPETQKPFWTQYGRVWRTMALVFLCLVCFASWYVISNMPDVRMRSTAEAGKGGFRISEEEITRLAQNPAWLLVIVIGTQFVTYACWLSQAGEGEVFLYRAGVSSWPFFSMNLAAVLVGAFLMLRALSILHQGRKKLDAQYFADEPQPEKTGRDAWLSRITLNWDKSRLVSAAKGGGEPVLEVSRLWRAFRGSSMSSVRLARSGIITCAILAAVWLLSDLLPQPNMPVRGGAARMMFWWVEKASLIVFIWLGVLVFDALWLNRIFIDWFGRGTSNWPTSATGRHVRMVQPSKSVRDYIDLRLIADWTRDMGRLTALPFFVLALLFMSRLSFFDAWRWPTHIGAAIGFMVLLVILAAWRAHAAAERLRRQALQDIQASPVDENTEKLANDIKGLSHGAFMPFLKQPVMEAVYWLVSALSVTGLWQAISQLVS
ncbi:MAG: hypothetical protein R3F13_09960 [Prosthecobacter sp.]